jgi:hypothetical protein
VWVLMTRFSCKCAIVCAFFVLRLSVAHAVDYTTPGPNLASVMQDSCAAMHTRIARACVL